jgi:hypothetical protein
MDNAEVYNWGWFSREDPRMHLQTVESKRQELYKVWLEKKGKRVFEPAAEIPSTVYQQLQAEVLGKRRHVEGRWVNFMIANHWISLNMKGSLVTVTAYPGVPGSRFTRVVDLVDYLQGIYNPRSQMWPKEPVKPEEVTLSRELPAIEIWPQKEESLRYHIFLPTILWQD